MSIKRFVLLGIALGVLANIKAFRIWLRRRLGMIMAASSRVKKALGLLLVLVVFGSMKLVDKLQVMEHLIMVVRFPVSILLWMAEDERGWEWQRGVFSVFGDLAVA